MTDMSFRRKTLALTAIILVVVLITFFMWQWLKGPANIEPLVDSGIGNGIVKKVVDGRDIDGYLYITLDTANGEKKLAAAPGFSSCATESVTTKAPEVGSTVEYVGVPSSDLKMIVICESGTYFKQK
jgi:hypothetical protein